MKFGLMAAILVSMLMQGGQGDEPELATAPSDLASDSIPVRTADGALARYGIPSGKIMLRYSGDAAGGQTLLFDQWGMRERSEDSLVFVKNDNYLSNTIFILMPEHAISGNKQDSTYQQFPNKSTAMFLKQDRLKRKSYGESLMGRSGKRLWKRLPDTTISGYHCRVFFNDEPDWKMTMWYWRGIAIRMHMISISGGGKDTTDYWCRAVSIEPNITLPSSTFSPPPGWNDRSTSSKHK